MHRWDLLPLIGHGGTEARRTTLNCLEYETTQRVCLRCFQSKAVLRASVANKEKKSDPPDQSAEQEKNYCAECGQSNGADVEGSCVDGSPAEAGTDEAAE